MYELLYLLIGWAVGLVVCVALARTIIVRYRLPWRATLMYFGLIPYPDEILLPRLPRLPRQRRSP